MKRNDINYSQSISIDMIRNINHENGITPKFKNEIINTPRSIINDWNLSIL